MSDTLAKLIAAAQMLEARAADRRRLLQEVKDAAEQATLDGCGFLIVYPTDGLAYARADRFVPPRAMHHHPWRCPQRHPHQTHGDPMKPFRRRPKPQTPTFRTLHVTRAKDSTAKPFFMTTGEELAYYGSVLTGRPFDHIILHDAPTSEEDKAWVRDEARSRLAPGGTIFHNYPAEPVERARFTFAGTTPGGNYSFAPENYAARAMLPPGLTSWTVSPVYFWTGDSAE